MSEFTGLHHPTDDVQATFDWLLSIGFTVIEARGGTGIGQQVGLFDGGSRIWITRDRGHWMLDLRPAGWGESVQLDQLCAVMRLEHLPTDGLGGAPPVQLPPNEPWSECVPEAIAWAVDRPYRSVFIDIERHHYGTRKFGGSAQAPSLDRIEGWVRTLAEAIDAPPHRLPTYGFSEDMARPHVEVSGSSMAFVVIERGDEFERIGFADAIDLVAHVFRGVTFGMAVDWEVDHRREAEDFRRRLWAKQLVLLDRLHPRWAEQLVVSHEADFRDVGLDPTAAASIVENAAG